MRGVLSSTIALAAMALPRPAAAIEPPLPECRRGHAVLEMEPWFALGAGGNSYGHATGEASFDLGATLPLWKDVLRIGVVTQARTTFATFDPSAGLRLLTTSETADTVNTHGILYRTRWFFGVDAGAGYAWRGGFLRAAGDRPFEVVRAALGFRQPLELLELYGSEYACPRHSPFATDWRERYGRPFAGIVSGFGVYASFRRSVDAPLFWEGTFGFEFELIGAGWLLFSGR